MDQSNEAFITVNGHALTKSQSMTVRVALSSFLGILEGEGIGDDEHGKRMEAAYRARLTEIFALMSPPSERKDTP
jgi:hypothetical protein